MPENEIAHQIVDVAFKIHTRLGPGVFESIYESILESELTKRGLSVERQKGIPVVWEHIHFKFGFAQI